MKTLALVAMLLAAGCTLIPQTATVPTVLPSTILPARTNMLRRAVCIGWNRVDPAKWGGWSGYLSDCEFDAELWYETWRDYGFEATNLLTEAATIANCKEALKWGLRDMKAGDLLVVEVSGHGGQGADSQGEGSDGKGEYICAYDGPVSDNVINSWLREVPEGVMILWGCDTCHSGDMHKQPAVRFSRKATSGFKGQLILLAGCSEDKFSLSTGQGGLWSRSRLATGPKGVSPKQWFESAKARVPAEKQIPVYTEYGNVTADFRDRILVGE